MRDAFRQHHRPTDIELRALWDACVFVPDASTLLNVYRYADSTRKDLFQILRKLSGRVWIPYQVAQEFYRNRLQVIQEQNKKYIELENQIDGFIKSLEGGNFQKSAFLCVKEIVGVLKPAIAKAKQLVEQQNRQHPDLIHNDVYLEELVEIVGSAIGQEPDQTSLDKLYADAQKRIDKKRPPGYMDTKKPEPDRYGDVLIWFELLERADATKQPTVFVTDDDKEDWWQIVQGEKLGPRPELREEMRKRAGVEFYIYNSARFLEMAGQQLDLSVAKSSVDDAIRVSEELHSNWLSRLKVRRTSRRLEAAKAVFEWLSSEYPDSPILQMGDDLPDFILHTDAGPEGYEMFYHRNAERALQRVQTTINLIKGYKPRIKMRLNLVFVIDDPRSVGLESLVRTLSEGVVSASLPKIVIGTMTYDGKFQVAYTLFHPGT